MAEGQGLGSPSATRGQWAWRRQEVARGTAGGRQVSGTWWGRAGSRQRDLLTFLWQPPVSRPPERFAGMGGL